METYKVLEKIWYYNNSCNDDYRGTFNSLEEAKKFVEENEKEWETDTKEYSETGVDVIIETWEEDEDPVDFYIAWTSMK